MTAIPKVRCLDQNGGLTDLTDGALFQGERVEIGSLSFLCSHSPEIDLDCFQAINLRYFRWCVQVDGCWDIWRDTHGR